MGSKAERGRLNDVDRGDLTLRRGERDGERREERAGGDQI